MAIGFGRVEFIKRSEGRNSCQLSSYLSRSRLFFEGNCALEPKLYDFSHRETVSYHEILLPKGADENLKIPEILWNQAEKKEIRKDAQVSMHLVLALPDDKEITHEDRITLTKTYIEKNYPNLPAELVIHPPERTLEFTQKNEALGIPKGTKATVIEEKNGNYILALPKEIRPNPFITIGTQLPNIFVHENNWHAHIQLTTRRLKANGKGFEDKKANDLMPTIKKGKVISGPDIGKLWAKHQNDYFRSKGLALTVDDNALVPQIHLGPKRLRGRPRSLLKENENRQELNEIAASNPQNILNAITKRQSIFTKEEVTHFILKHTPADKIQEVRTSFWNLQDIIQLRSLKTKAFLSKFTTQTVIEEEKHILRLADRIHHKKQKKIPTKIEQQFTHPLTPEQKTAYQNILNGKGLSCIQGYAGTGKSFLLQSLKNAYEERGLTIRSFGPDNATANILKDKGFPNAENIYRFLFSAKHGHQTLHKSFEVWILDEAGKLSNKPLLEFLKLAETKGAKVILAGDSAQLPPVERGGLFKIFCKRYGAETLEEIQRQKNSIDRAMAKNLAHGQIGHALDKLTSQKGLHWSLTRQESLENLVTKWAEDHQDTLSKDSSLIIAGTNNEVRVLNEMIHLIRIERKEISPQEFKCETAHGTLYISEGDRIEFRKNDQELSLTNGMSGILLKAEKNHFLVALQENGKKNRLFTFNPKNYHRFQLGYASTCSRAQGKTIQNSYILHSSHLNKQMAYVSLTRHIEKAHYFLSKEDALNLSDLKRKALRDGTKQTTLEYTSTKEIERDHSQAKRKEKIETLKNSEKLLKRLQGTSLNLLDRLNLMIDKKHDRKPNQDFFNFKEEKEPQATIHKLPQEEHNKIIPSSPEEKITPQKLVKEILEKETPKNKETIKIEPKAQETIDEQHTPHPFKSLTKSPSSWKDLPQTDQKLIKAYFDRATKASELREVAEAQCSETLKEITTAPHYKKWQKACGERNEAAYHLTPLLSKEIFNKTTRYYINCQADKHQKRLTQAHQQENYQTLTTQLTTHIEPLLYKLFPDGPSTKTPKHYRFGTKGSLSITHTGPKAGTYYDFENQEGGNLLHLIQKELHLDKSEARTWAGEFLGHAPDINLPTTYKKRPPPQKETNWHTLKPDPNTPVPPPKTIGSYIEQERYPYKNEQGELLYYLLRLQNDKGDKITPPLSYGYEQERPNHPHWKLKGFDHKDQKRTLYRLEEITKNPLTPILIVEGEKTADAALAKLKTLRDKEYIAITWHGGCQAPLKTDWTPLAGKEVLIWPDNDKGGFQAAHTIENELLKIGAKAIRTIDQEWLQEKFEKKWDLADPWPKNLFKSDLLEKSRGLPIHDLRDPLLRQAKPKTPDEKIALTDIVYHYKKSHQHQIEEELLGKSTYSKGLHLRQTSKKIYHLYQKEEKIYKRLGEDPQINASGDLQKHLARQCTLYRAKYNKEPPLTAILLMKETIQETEKVLPHHNPDLLECTKQRTLEKLIASPQEEPKELFKTQSKEIDLAKTKGQEMEKHTLKQQAMEKELSQGHDLGR